jgi:acyl carrier protein
MMNQLLDLIQNTFQIDFNITEQTPLLSSGLIDSLHVAQLLTLLEQHYGKRIAVRDIGVDNFDTPAQICRYLTR